MSEYHNISTHQFIAIKRRLSIHTNVQTGRDTIHVTFNREHFKMTEFIHIMR